MMPGLDGLDGAAPDPRRRRPGAGPHADRARRRGRSGGRARARRRRLRPQAVLAARAARPAARRAAPRPAGRGVASGWPSAGIEVDVGSPRRSRVDGAAVELTGARARHPGRAHAPGRPGRAAQLAAAEAGRGDVAVNERTVDVHISRLRKKLGDDGGAARIRTVRGVGYVLVARGREATVRTREERIERRRQRHGAVARARARMHRGHRSRWHRVAVLPVAHARAACAGASSCGSALAIALSCVVGAGVLGRRPGGRPRGGASPRSRACCGSPRAASPGG